MSEVVRNGSWLEVRLSHPGNWVDLTLDEAEELGNKLLGAVKAREETRAVAREAWLDMEVHVVVKRRVQASVLAAECDYSDEELIEMWDTGDYSKASEAVADQYPIVIFDDFEHEGVVQQASVKEVR